MNIADLAAKKILILGMGKEGRATYRFLRQSFPKVALDTADEKDGTDYLKKQFVADIVIKTPGIPKRLVTRPYTTATNIFFAHTNGFTIGITGSKGKSTTASLIYAIFKKAGMRAHLVGNIGRPMLPFLLTERTDGKDVYVCELSSYQLEDIAYSPRISVIVNLFPEHLDYHDGYDAYKQAKMRILAHAGKNDFFVFNPDYPDLVRLAKTSKAKAIPFITRLPFGDNDIPLLGVHNKDNVRAAVTVARLMGVSDEDCRRAVKSFKPLPHRLEPVGTFQSVSFYDDAIATTPEATIQAIQTLVSIGTILLGGFDRGYDFSNLVRAIVRFNIPNIVLFPDSGERIKILLEKEGQRRNILTTSSMKDAIRFAYRYTRKGSICLLSTASPSYSLWKNFEQKGDEFQYYMKQLNRAGKTKT